MARVGHKAFATCPTTENGQLRIVGHPKYPNSPGPPSDVMAALLAFRALPGHAFWADGLSVADDRHFDAARLTGHARVTDSYLLALTTANKGKLAALDRKLASDAVPGGAAALVLI